MTARGQFDLVGHNLIRYDEFDSLSAPNNWIITPDAPENSWTTTLMKLVGEWRAILRSTYIRWAMAINGLHVAATKYQAETIPKKFTVSSIRSEKSGRTRQEVVAEYPFKDAAAAHLKIQPMLCAHGFIDMYAGLEEMIFAMYRSYLLTNPDPLIEGPDFVMLRKLRRNSSESAEAKDAWDKAFVERLDKWQRNKLYDGLDRVFLAFCQTAGLRTPAGYKHTTVETWSYSIGGISLMRNLLIHGENAVPKDLADFCKEPYSLGFTFDEGELLRLSLRELQLIETFCDSLLTALNISLMERAKPSLRDEAAKRFESHKK
jgi:hypothetical protein